MIGLTSPSLGAELQRLGDRLSALERASNSRPEPMPCVTASNAADLGVWPVGDWGVAMDYSSNPVPISLATAVPKGGLLVASLTLYMSHVYEAPTELRADIEIDGPAGIRSAALPGIWARTGGTFADPDGDTPGSMTVWKVFTGLQPTTEQTGQSLVRVMWRATTSSFAFFVPPGLCQLTVWGIA